MKRILVLIGWLVILVFCQRAICADLTVGTGGSYQYSNIQDAIDAANTGDTVLVSAGTYTGSRNYNIDFYGKNITLRSAAGAASTIIDCQSAGRGVSFQSGESSSAVLNGFTIRNAYVNDASGAGIYCYNSSPTITNCIIANNVAHQSTSGVMAFGGGMLFWGNSNPTITNCTFSGNSGQWGGGLCVNGSNAAISNCTFSGNSAGYFGGALFNIGDATSSLTNCIMNGNSSNGGGAIWNQGYLDMTQCTVTQNTSFKSSNGTLYNYSGGAVVTNCIFWGNNCQWEIYEHGGAFVATYSDIKGRGGDGTGNIDANPLFAGTNDFRLLAGSPCIDAGMDAGCYADIDGNLRPYYTGLNPNGFLPGFDIGAYEFVPEPATLLLLGLGAVILRKRR